MTNWKSISAHLLTAATTLALVALLYGGRLGTQRPLPVHQIPGFRRLEPPVTAKPTRPTGYQLRAVPSLSIPPDLLKCSDAEEQINIRVYQGVNRSVVNITTASEATGIFGDETSSGTGSGFVIDTDGHILTNYHVVEDAESVQVTLYDGTTHEAHVIGADASNDVAIVKVQAPAADLHPVALGDSSGLLVGQKILALGNPFGLERTLTTGIISSLDRSLQAKNGRMIKGIIQTDAAINPGNSGGPLLNSRGQVIGMNTAIMSQVGQSAGISFAVPINAIARIIKPLIEHGRVIRADLGITRVFTTNEGLVVLGLVEDGPAERAGIQPIQVKVVRYGGALVRKLDPESADVLVAIDGKAVHNVDELLTEVESHAPGQVAKVTVRRGGRTLEIRVTLGKS
ncbi:serine protease, S1-C subfamily, contains C-terminal PDZ domain [Singulisphaera sp. GP187]|uniref:S1C family serine protease n=1 Tax=Singulisphaera sp. GP187 TaxID=1882752 RepID=UPI000928761B|nr:trypsin-like peptidase domain-containing protein [Singulisphaera sp. GP187]SIO66473.1 serine protease, S1-C subfamily, contains C-terminal PDZ domain [Singulisphaera sp. GP187]